MPSHTRTQALLADLYARQERARVPAPSAPAPMAPSMASPKAPALPADAGVGQGPLSLFSALGRAEFLEVLAQMERREAGAGESIVREGTPGVSMFVIVEGEAEVVRQAEGGQGVTVARMGQGEFSLTVKQGADLRQKLEQLGTERMQRTARLFSGRPVHMGDARV